MAKAVVEWWTLASFVTEAEQAWITQWEAGEKNNPDIDLEMRHARRNSRLG